MMDWYEVILSYASFNLM